MKRRLMFRFRLPWNNQSVSVSPEPIKVNDDGGVVAVFSGEGWQTTCEGILLHNLAPHPPRWPVNSPLCGPPAKLSEYDRKPRILADGIRSSRQSVRFDQALKDFPPTGDSSFDSL